MMPPIYIVANNINNIIMTSQATSSRSLLLSLLVTCTTMLTSSRSASITNGLSYGVIVDAGSSGSRVHVYQWPRRPSPYTLPHFKRILNIRSSNSGDQRLADYAYRPEDVHDHLGPLVDRAASVIPPEDRAATPIYVLATAGMRLVEGDRAEAILAKINSLLSNPDFSPFRHHRRNVRILSGEEEGAFAWLAVNYFMGYFDDPDKVKQDRQLSTGIVEMGGASTQIAFLPAGSILSDKFDMHIAARHYSLYVHSYLDYGTAAANSWIDTYLATVDQPHRDPVTNPCLPSGYSVACDQRKCGRNVTMTGGSQPSKCMAVLETLIYKADTRRCSPKPCAIGTVYQPPIDGDMMFLAMSSFHRTLDKLDVLYPNGSFVPSSIYQPAIEICAKDFVTINRDHSSVSDKFRHLLCFNSIFTPLLLTKGLGFANDSRQLMSKHKIDNMDLDWSVGAILYESERENIEWQCRYPPSRDTPQRDSISSFASTSSAVGLTSVDNHWHSVTVFALTALTLCTIRL